MKRILLIIYLFIFHYANAQDDSNRIEKIDTVNISTTKGISVNVSNIYNLSDRTSQIGAVFIKKYGRGMLSTISLHGTDASHTQVIWNGIPINSVLNGQVDLNTIYLNEYNNVSLKKGGNSIQYGSGAIGGIITFDDEIKYLKNHLTIDNQMQIGSFNSIRNNNIITYSNNKTFMRLGFQTNKSNNNYPFVGYDINNENGAYFGKDLNLILGYEFNNKNEIYYKSQANWLNREMSRSLYRPDNAKLLTNNQRYLLGWKYKSDKIKIHTDLAYLYEKYQYFFNKNKKLSSNSYSNVWYIINTINYQFTKNTFLKFGNSLNFSEGIGDAIAKHSRQQYAIYGVWKQQLKKICYQIKLRKEFTNAYKIPLVAGAEISYNFNKTWRAKASINTNYRVPTFNDLYWNPGGNPDLLPENSLSVDISQKFKFKSIKVNISGFYIRSSNLIKWRPITADFWQPINIAETSSKGIDVEIKTDFRLNHKFNVNFAGSYTYQNVKDELIHKKLPYLPAQIFHGMIIMKYHKFIMHYQADFNDKIYTTTSLTQYIDSSLIHNVSLKYRLSNHLSLEGKVDNIFNTFYQTIPSRPQPGRNYSININFKIHQYNEKN